MSSASAQIFAEWSLPWPLTLAILLFATVYLRGWAAIRKTRRELFGGWRLLCFFLGLAVLWVALASPLDGFADALLSAHMIEHLLLMSAVPPLVLFGLPTVPLLRGLPKVVIRSVLAPLLRTRLVRKAGALLGRPAIAWLAMNLIFLLWHVPAAYDFALENENWHRVEHLCFLSSSLLFWWPVVQPWPSRRQRLRWGMLLYLLAADFVNTAMSAFLAFCDRPVYRYYLERPNAFGIDPLADQVTGAVIMWVLGSVVFLVPAVALTVRLLEGGPGAHRRQHYL